MSSERTAEIRNAIKAAFPDYKFSIINEHHSGMRIAILSGPIQLLSTPDTIARGRESVNHKWLNDHYAETPDILAVLRKITDIADEGNGTESEDGDYGRIPHFYLTIEIGRWDEPYKVIAKSHPVTLNATEYKKLLPAKGKLATCKLNKAKGGIELYFPGKPAQAILDDLKANGFRWGKYNKCWYRADNSISRQVASKYAQVPSEEVNQDAGLVDAQEQAAIANGNY